MQAVVRIQDAAQTLGVSVSTIRRYEREGLVTPAPRNRAGHRVYTSDELEALHAALFPQAEPK
jgi:DNA-binding transcriptional MerR regulator